MAFVIKKQEDFLYNSPQEMYQDNKLKKIRGLLDYQSEMITEYMKSYAKKNVALELPTGSGKTLVGLLIGEYRRRKNKERVLYLCPTNQLVNQVADQAINKYGLNVIAFCGKQSEYKQADKGDFELAKAIGISTYSSFFATHTYFKNVDIIIMDDVHSSEEFIISNWTVQVNASDLIFNELAALLKPYISENDYINLTSKEFSPDLFIWNNMIPVPLISDQIKTIYTILKEGIAEGTANYYAFNRIAENLNECNFYISNQTILIRPWIAPTISHSPFENVKQRILMSATLGVSGELERITGVGKIDRLPVVNGWDKKGIGRKLFVFPDLSLSPELYGEVILKLQKYCKKGVYIVPGGNLGKDVRKLLESLTPTIKVLNVKDIEESKKIFNDNDEAAIIMENRFDGVDFADDESRLLVIMNLPKTTNIQEKFLVYNMGASILYEERIQTRIIQAVGRCSRNPSDYSIVCILGDSIRNELFNSTNVKRFPPELRAEIQFGMDNASSYKSVSDIMENVEMFLNHTPEWIEADEHIIELRNSYCQNPVEDDEESKRNKENAIRLQQASIKEINFQDAMWKKTYKEAFNIVSEIIDILDTPSLTGYKCFWQINAACVAKYLVEGNNIEYRDKGIKLLECAQKNNIKVKWLSNLSQKMFRIETINQHQEDYFEDIICGLEQVFTRYKGNKLERQIKEVMELLNSNKGIEFERGHQKLGGLLGYRSKNDDSSAAPDPYWIINNDIVIVSEDKIYEEKDGGIKPIPVNDIREANTHERWIRSKEKELYPRAEIISVLISNSEKIDEAWACNENLFYVSKKEFVNWAIEALTIIRKAESTFTNVGNQEWRNSIHKLFIDNHITPKDFLNFIRRTKLSDLYKG